MNDFEPKIPEFLGKTSLGSILDFTENIHILYIN